MKVTSFLRAGHFGTLHKLHGIITYKISAYEQRAFPNFFKQALPNTFRRIRSNLFIVAPRKYLVSCKQEDVWTKQSVSNCAFVQAINNLIFSTAFIVGYIIYDLCERRHAQLQRKDPNEYKNDV